MLKQGLPAQVAQQLLRRIINNEFPAGAVLPSEREIAETYAVSRPVAREAIKLLAARGIVAVHPRQGATVGRNLTAAAGEALLLAFHQEQVVQEDVLDLRMLIEPHVAGLAALQATSAQHQRLRQLRDTIEMILAALNRGDRAQADQLWKQTDSALHVAVAEMSQNRAFRILIEVIDTILWPDRALASPELTDDNLRQASLQHLAICDALLARDQVAAQNAMTTHLEYTRDQLFSQREQLHRPLKLVLE